MGDADHESLLQGIFCFNALICAFMASRLSNGKWLGSGLWGASGYGIEGGNGGSTDITNAF